MRNNRQYISTLTKSIISGSALLLGAATAQAGPGGSVTFSPLSAESIPVLGSTMLLLLALLLAFIAFVSFRKRENGVVPVITGALALASLVSAGGGVNLLHKAYAGDVMGLVISSPAGETKVINGGAYNSYFNDSGVALKIGPVILPPGDCPSGALGLMGACVDGSNLADGDQCEIDCRIAVSDSRLKADIVQVGITNSGLPWYQFRYTNGATVYEGVMAQDVLTHTPAAVHFMSNGYMAVDYAMLGLSMQAVN